MLGISKSSAKEGENKMKVLITIKRSPGQRYLVHLITKQLIAEVRELINSKKHSEAMVKAFTKGRFVREISESELPNIEADLILSENNARWDLKK